MGEIKFLTALVFTGLFALAIGSYVIEWSNDNDVAVNFADDADLVAMNKSISEEEITFFTDINSSTLAFAESEVAENSETTKTGGQFKTNTKSGRSMVTTAVTNSFNKIFGRDGQFAIVFTTFMTLLASIGMLLAWKTWAGRNPE